MKQKESQSDIIRSLTPTIEKQIEFSGISISLSSEVVSGLIDITFSPERHEVALNLSPLPTLRNCYFPSDPYQQPVPVGALSLHPAGVPYRIVTRLEHYRFVIFSITPERYLEKVGQNHQWDPRKTTDILGTPMNATMFRMAQELERSGFASERQLAALSESLVIDMARFARGCQHEARTSSAGLSSDQLGQIMDYVERAEGIALTITDIAERLKISPRHLSRLFKMSTGRTIHSYVTEVRLRKAMTLLTNSALPLKEVSHRLGFSCQSGFSSEFRQATGKTPKEFRNQSIMHHSNRARLAR